tara:strand:+ start:192 stop:386 length:195 start_codon:yes stop_codon:yes gene_type:complete
MSSKKQEFQSVALCVFAAVIGFTLVMAMESYKNETPEIKIVPVEEYNMHDLIHPTTQYDLDKVA